MQALHLSMVVACFGLASCAPPAEKGGFESPSPGAKLYAITNAARTNDHSAVPELIEQLLSDDPVVRFAAIRTLEQLTGRTYGYQYYDELADRRRAVDRWVAAVESGELDSGPSRAQPGP